LLQRQLGEHVSTPVPASPLSPAVADQAAALSRHRGLNRDLSQAIRDALPAVAAMPDAGARARALAALCTAATSVQRAEREALSLADHRDRGPQVVVVVPGKAAADDWTARTPVVSDGG